MKKVYEKPKAYIENFSLCTNIAAGCEVTTNLQSEGQYGCGYLVGRFDTMVFTSVIGCNTTENVDPENPSHDGICYHVPNEAYNLFNS